MVGWQFGVWLLCQRLLPLERGLVLVPLAPVGAARGSGIPRGRTEIPGGRTKYHGAGASRAALIQHAHGTKLSVSTHQHYCWILLYLLYKLANNERSISKEHMLFYIQPGKRLLYFNCLNLTLSD